MTTAKSIPNSFRKIMMYYHKRKNIRRFAKVAANAKLGTLPDVQAQCGYNKYPQGVAKIYRRGEYSLVGDVSFPDLT